VPLADRSFLTALDRTLAPLASAAGLPARAYLDPAVLEVERRAVFEGGWVSVAHGGGLGAAGSFALAPLTPAGLLVARGPDLALRAFHNRCRHRGAALVTAPAGRQRRFICPYHGWRYGLDGQLEGCPAGSEPAAWSEPAPRAPTPDERAALALGEVSVAELSGFVFASLAPPAPIDRWFAGLAAELDRFPLRSLVLGRAVEHEARANWKVLAENFLESHHFRAVHPALEALTPARLAGTLPPEGAWFGGTMELSPGAETVALGGQLDGRPRLAPGPDRIIHDYLIFPGFLLSVQPDYLLTYRLWPESPGLTRVRSEIWFPPATAHDPAFDPRPVYTFWDTTNEQDRRICESQQRGLASPGYEPGPFAPVEESVHRFDGMIARAYQRHDRPES
jgi:Rieske 2Fe-2S family protein